VVLRERSRGVTQVGCEVILGRDAVDEEGSGRGIVEPGEQFDDGGFSAAVGAHDDYELTGFDGE